MSELISSLPDLDFPDRLYLHSDTYGGDAIWSLSPDIDAIITTHIRSGIKHVVREFDIFGREKITDHILRAALKLHDERKNAGTTGIFINSAPRTKKNSNGEPFYRAETDNGVRIVSTPLEALSAIKGRVTRLQHLSNEDNELYDALIEQFRSSIAVILLASNHGIPLIEDDPNIIPDYPSGCRLAYVDRFKNLVLHEHAAEDPESVRKIIRECVGRVCQLNIGGIRQKVIIGTSLSQADPGSLAAYCNDGNIEVITKWSPEWNARKKLQYAAFEQFHRPEIGARVSIKP